jgi:uncharacterized protein YcbX
MPRLVSIHVYPLKSARGVDLTKAAVEPWGLAGDRRWMLVDPEGRFISQRSEPSLARIAVHLDASGSGLLVSTEGHPPLHVPVPDDNRLVAVQVWRSEVKAALAGAEADAWFSAVLGRPVQLVHLDDPTRRLVDPAYGQPGDRVSFADGYPLLITAASSLDALRGWIDARHGLVPMNRFRPNAVVEGTEPWAEDRWRRIRIGDVVFRAAKPSSRCLVTTTDQRTGERGSEPLKALGRHRRFGTKLVFGMNLIPDAPGTIRLGDEITVLE